MFDLTHCLFLAGAAVVLTTTLVLLKRGVKHRTDIPLKVFALATVVCHYSILWVDYFTTGSAQVVDNLLLPIFPCNIATWLLVVVAFVPRRDTFAYRTLAECAFYLGTIGGVIGLVFNQLYDMTPTLADYEVLSGLVEHTIMLGGALWLPLAGYVQIRARNAVSTAIGELVSIVLGYIMIGLHLACGLESPNCMYLLELPFPDFPWVNTWTIALVAELLIFAVGAGYERFALPRDQRWYNQFRRKK